MVDTVSSIPPVGNVLGYRVTAYSARQPVKAIRPAGTLQGNDQKSNPEESPSPAGAVPVEPPPRKETSSPQESGQQNAAGEVLSAEEQKLVDELKSIDRRVRAHELAHVAAGGILVTHSATYTYRTGPDGQRYAVAGEVQIDTGAVSDDPDATLRKAAQVVRAALAPVDPSPQDRQVAAAAASLQMQARAEIARQAYQSNEPTQQETVPVVQANG